MAAPLELVAKDARQYVLYKDERKDPNRTYDIVLLSLHLWFHHPIAFDDTGILRRNSRYFHRSRS